MSKIIKFNDGDEIARQVGERVEQAIADGVRSAADALMQRMKEDLDHQVLYGSYPTRSSDGAPAVPETHITARIIDDEPVSSIWGLPVRQRDDDQIQMTVSEDEPCIACGRLLIDHPGNLQDKMDVRYHPSGGFAHKLCIIEEAEVVEIKALPPGESHETD